MHGGLLLDKRLRTTGIDAAYCIEENMDIKSQAADNDSGAVEQGRSGRDEPRLGGDPRCMRTLRRRRIQDVVSSV